MLLVVGGSAAGKSRSTAEALRARLPTVGCSECKRSRLAEPTGAPLTEVAPGVVWLDDVQLYAHQAFPDTLKRLLNSEAMVVGTIRRAEMDVLTATGDLRNPTGDALSDEARVERVDWRTTWSSEELDRLGEHVQSPALLAAATAGTPPGAYSVAGRRSCTASITRDRTRTTRSATGWCERCSTGTAPAPRGPCRR